MNIDQPITVDLLDTPGVPALSSTSDMPVVETKPDAQNEGAPPAAAPAKEPEQPGESATPATEGEEPEQSGEPAKKESRGVQKALDRLTAEREEQRKRAEAAEEREKQLLEALNKGKPPEPEPAPAEADTGPKRPSRQDYPDEAAYQAAEDAYIDQRADWVARNTLEKERAEAAKKAEAEAIEAGAKAAQEKYVERIAKAKEKYADYAQVAESPDVQVSREVGLVLLHAENGPDLQYYLGSNPEEAKRLHAMPIPLQLVELGVIGAKLAAPKAEQAPAPKPEISRAPAPIKPNRASSEIAAKNPDEMSMDEYAAYHKKREAEARTRH